MEVDKYLEIFIDEAGEHIKNLSDEILVLEKEHTNQDTINEIFRVAHSLKGMAGTMGFKNMQTLTHDMENVFQEVRSGNISVNSDMVDVLFQCLDALDKYLDIITNTGNEGSETNADIISKLRNFTETKDSKSAEQPTEQPKEQQKVVAPVTFSEEEKKEINSIIQEGRLVYHIHVRLADTCVLKSARAFLIFKNLKVFGKILKTFPDKEMIDSEKFDFTIDIWLASDETSDKIKEKLKKISEVREVLLEKMDLFTQEAEKKTVQPKQSIKSVKVEAAQLDELMNLVSELIIAKNGIIAKNKYSEDNEYKEQLEYLENVTASMQDKIMEIRMMPLDMVTSKFPRMMRDLSRKLSKKFDFEIQGEDTKLDRTVLDEIGDPLMHILRNSADHGIETPDIRVSRGKNETGKITLSASQMGETIVLRVQDDGSGIDLETVKDKALEKGLVSKEQAANLNERQIVDLLFLPGFSTSKKVSDVSGRGVGLDVVKTKIESLKGTIEVKQQTGKGTEFIIRLPMTLAIMQALLVQSGEEIYAIPIENIDVIEDYKKDKIVNLHGSEIIRLGGNVGPLVHLSEVFQISTDSDQREEIIVVVKRGDKQLGIVVENIVGQQDIVIKSLGSHLQSVTKYLLGATIMGNGHVVLIMDTNALIAGH